MPVLRAFWKVLLHPVWALAALALGSGAVPRAHATNPPDPSLVWCMKTALEEAKALWAPSRILLFGPSLPNRGKSPYGAAGKALALLTDQAAPVAKALLPIPLPKAFLRSRSFAIFQKVWESPSYELSAEEARILGSERLEGQLGLFRQMLKEHPIAVRTRKGFEAAAKTAIGLGLAYVLLHAFNQEEDGLITGEDFLKTPRFKPGRHQIQLLLETVPFPHLSLRMGDRVYSYGRTHLTVSTITEYMDTKRLAEAFRDLSGEGTPEPNPDILDRVLSGVGLSNLPRSVQVVTLNLQESEYNRLFRHLEEQRGNRYHNVTFVNDCAAMLARALDRTTGISISRLIDASPSQITLALSARRAARDPRVGSVLQVAFERSDSPYFHLARNLYINAMESKIFIASIPLNQTWRAWIDLSRDESQLQWKDSATREVIEKDWAVEMKNFVAESETLSFIRTATERFQSRAKDGTLSKDEIVELAGDLRASLDDAVDEIIRDAERELTSPISDMPTRMKARYRIESAKAEGARILKIIDSISARR